MAVFYDVFNGDADGICALHQLRLAEPRASVLVTGVKRDIALLGRIEAQAGDEITVLDVSLAHNAAALCKQLERGASCRYFDHHFPGEIPAHPNLTTFIDTAPDVCTSLLVDRYLDGRQRIWAVVAAFGDNLATSARKAAAVLELNEPRLAQLQELGECINYNAYGDSVDDLYYEPADLYQTLHRYADPFEFISGEPVFDILRNGCTDDLYRAGELKPEMETGHCAVFVLPDAAWSRRVSGLFANRLAQQHPRRAHAVLTVQPGGFVVSVRAPLADPRGADELCLRFESGGGRAGAAGINLLPEPAFDRFVAALMERYPAE
ncbi:MAG: acetyltransferase [Betaproteobacteria bacterium]|nr:acetyltransferase [Betaproteobacteria bacterium]